MKGFLFVPIQLGASYTNECRKVLNSELKTYKVLDNTPNFETAKDYDLVWTEKSLIVPAQEHKHFLDYDLEGLKSLLKEYEGYGIIFYSLFDNSDLANIFPSRQGKNGNALQTIKDFCDTEAIDYSRINFVTPGFEKFRKYPFNIGTLDFAWAGAQGCELFKDLQNFDQTEIINNKKRLMCFHHLNWRTHRSLFLFALDKLNKECVVESNISYWKNFQYSGNFLNREIANLKQIFEGDDFYSTISTDTMQVKRGHIPVEDISYLKQQPANNEVKQAYVGVSIQAEPDNSNMRAEDQVFKSALYYTPHLLIGSKGIMRKFNDHYQMDIFEDLWAIGGGLSSIDKLPKSEQRVRAAVNCISKMYDNIEQVKKWFENDANIKRLKLNRQRVIEIIKKNQGMLHNHSEALPLLESLGYV